MSYRLNPITGDLDLVQDANGDVPEAPKDGKMYARKDGAWVEVVGGGGGAWDGTLQSPDGTRWQLSATDAGTLILEEIL